ncbi:MAG TPA: hypothetical protein VJC13_00415 [Candidatus Paceibacterota bacterium]
MSPEENNESSIERLKRTLYSRNEKLVPKEKRTPVSGREVNAPKDWGTEASFGLSPDALNNSMTKSNNSFFNKFLLYSSLFFLAALGIAGFIFFGGLNMISSNNLDIKITAPSSISSGEDLSVGLSVVNGNRTDLENATLYIVYPQGSETVGGDAKPLSYETISLGTIASGGTIDHSVRVLLSGEKDSTKTFDFRIEYKVKGSDAIFSKEKTYDVLINSSPVLIDVTYPKEIDSGQSITLSIDITSNSSVVVKNSLVKVEYPYGFTYKDSNMKPLRNLSAQIGNSVWNIGDLKNGDKKTLTITGTLVGQDQEDRTFNISLGTQSSGSTTDFDTALATTQASISIRKSLFNLSLEASTENIYMGQSVPVMIQWQNTLTDKIVDTRVMAVLSGNAFDRNIVKVNDGGFYRSSDNTIIWDKSNVNQLASISPGDSGLMNFSVGSLGDLASIRSVKNPHIDIHVAISGTRSGTETSAVSSTQDITIKLPTNLGFTSKIYRNIGPFSNTGPIPPRADKESTYTVTWTLTNTANDLKDTTVMAKLPAGVAWKNEVSPAGEKISFDANTGTITWNAGSVSAGTGIGYSPREVSFKIGFTPSISQINLAPDLLSNISAMANDTYAEVQVSVSIGSVNAQYSDPSYKNGDNIVTK